MLSSPSRKATFPICQKVYCRKNDLSDRIFWKREIDHQYQFYVASLKAERDAKYLIEEHSTLLKQIESAETANVELRKKIRLFQIELYTIYQRNAHDSCIIDGLHEADYEREETDLLESQIRHRLNFASVEGDHEECLLEIVKEEISLLKRKIEEDAKLVTLIKPLDKHLKEVLEEEKMKTHQQSKKFQRELEEILNEFRSKNSRLGETKAQRSAELTWAKDIFSSMFMVCEITPGTSETNSVSSSQETERFEVSGEDFSANDLDEKFQPMMKEYGEFVAMKELTDSKNIVTIHMIYDNIVRFTDGIGSLISEYLYVFDVITDVEYIKEYLGRLDMMRKKKEIPQLEENRSAQIVEEINLMYNTLLSEKAFISNILQYFISVFKDDFEVHCIILQKTEELFANPVTSEA